ncbi:MAG: hypothetical protein Q8P67_02925 [archaeon]|nr:hypothetical protein [archaeon]
MAASSSSGPVSSSSSSSDSAQAVLRSLPSADQAVAKKLAIEKNEEWSWGADVQVSKKSALLLVGKNRVYSSDRGKKHLSGHYLELTRISSKSPEEVELVFKSVTLSIKTPKADDLIHAVRCSFHMVFSNLPEPLKPALDLSSSRLQDLPTPASLPCAGYGAIYSSVCDFLGAPVRSDILWDIANVLGANNVTEFNIKEFEQPMRPEDQKTLLTSLAYSTHFESFVCKRFKLHKDAFAALAEAFALNRSIELLELRGVDIPKDGLNAACQAIQTNPNCSLTSIIISENTLTDDTFGKLGTAIGSLKKGLILLDLSNSKTKNGIPSLVTGFSKNRHMPTTLVRLNLSGNTLGSAGATAVASWLANPNLLQHLELAHTAANLDPIIAAIGRGSPELVTLDIQGNPITKKENGSLVRFVQGAGKLKRLNISETAIPADCLREAILAIGNNFYLQDFEIVARSNKFGAAGAGVIAQALSSVSNIGYADLGENDFTDEGIVSFCRGLVANSSLKHLGLGGNFSPGGGRAREPALESLIDLLNSECPIRSLDVRGSKSSQLKTDISTLLYALGTDNSLEHIDIGANGFGDKGALALSKALQTNKKLNSIDLDENSITADGFQSLAYGLKRNLTLKYMRLPILDISAAMPGGDTKKIFEEIVREIDGYITRNQSPQGKFKGGGAAGINTANMLLASAEREQLERLRFKIRANGRSLDSDETQIVEDAEANDSHIQSIHSIREQHHHTVSADIVQTMKGFVPQLVPVVERHQSQLIDDMMDFVSSRYRSLDPDTIGRLRRNIQFMGKEMDVSAVEKIIVDAASTEINNQIQECMMSAVEICTDYIYEKLGDLLQSVLDEVRKSPQNDDDDDNDESEYEEVEVECTDSDEEYPDDTEESVTTGEPEEPLSMPPLPVDPEEFVPPPRPDRGDELPLPSGLPPPITVPKPTIAPKPVLTTSDSVGSLLPGPIAPPSPGPGGPPVAPPRRPPRATPGSPAATQSEYPGVGAGPPAGGLPGRGRAVGGGIAARLEAMGGGRGIPMPGALPPPRAAPISPAPVAAPRPGTAGSLPAGRPSSGLGSQPVAASPSRPSPAAATAATSTPTKKGGFFSKGKENPQKKTKIVRRKVAKGGNAGAARRNLGPVAKPSGNSDVVAKIEAKESNITTHLTKDRPMIQRQRRPPTRRPRFEN